jgi:hypothetical protein
MIFEMVPLIFERNMIDLIGIFPIYFDALNGLYKRMGYKEEINVVGI